METDTATVIEEKGGRPVISKEQSFRIREKGLSPTSKGATLEPKKPTLLPETDLTKRFSGTWESEMADGMDGFLAEL
jgi:hypothetical protein